MAGEENGRVYARYIGLLNAQDFAALPEVGDPGRYREICVGYTPGWVDLPEAVTSLEKVVGGLPDLNARIDDLVSEDDEVYATLSQLRQMDSGAAKKAGLVAGAGLLGAASSPSGRGGDGGSRAVVTSPRPGRDANLDAWTS
jgi:hypothetical protein